MRISEAQYNDIYHGIEGLPQYSMLVNPPTSDEDFLMTRVTSKLWRMNNLYSVIDKDGKKVRFIMNYAQHIVYADHLRHPRLIILKSRQRGISTHYLIDYFDDALFTENLTIGMQSYGLEESAALLKRLDVAWDTLSPELREWMNLKITKSNTKALGFSTGSIVKIQTSFRGETLQRLHVSELGKIANKNPQKAVELKAGTLQALAVGNRAAIESTAEGRHNAFYEMWYDAVNKIGLRSPKDFKPVFLSWVDDPDCVIHIPQIIDVEDREYVEEVEAWLNSDEVSFINMEYLHTDADKRYCLSNEQMWWVVAQRRELGELFNQEYPYSPEAAFAAVRDGTYYARIWRARAPIGVVESGLYDPALPVFTSWDLGMNDSTEIGFWQVWRDGPRLVDYYYNTGEGLEHYFNVIKTRNYEYAEHVFPHDIKVKELGSAKSRLGLLKDMGMRKMRVLKRSNSVQNDIEVVRKMLPLLFVDAEKCGRVLKMFDRYTKAWDHNLGVFKDKPLHDEWSNPADMVRYFAMSGLWKKQKDITKKKTKRRSNVIGGMAL